MLRPMISTDLERVLSWRNHPDVRRYMYTQHIIQFSEHCAWFERASADPKKRLMVFETDDEPLGFASLSEVAAGGIAEWGFYTAPEAKRGTGRQLGREVLRFAFSKCQLHKLCGEVLGYNEPSIRFHLSLGFLREATLREQHFDGKTYHDVLRFGLLSNELPDLS